MTKGAMLMTNVFMALDRGDRRSRLFNIGVETLQGNGWTVERIPKFGKASVRRITKGGNSLKVSIRTSQDLYIAFPRNEDDTKWVTLSDVDAVVPVSVNDGENPRFARVHMIDGNEMRDRFDRTYAARRAAGHTIPLGRGVWLSLYHDEATSPPQLVGAGAANNENQLAMVPLDEGEGEGETVERDQVKKPALGRATNPAKANKEDILRENTYKDQGVDLTRRVFYTLQDDKGLQVHRNTKAIALLVNHVREKNLISDEEIDELLFDCIW